MAKMGRPKLSKDTTYSCLTCGTEYSLPEWEKSGTKYCSRKCFGIGQRGKGRPGATVQRVTKHCERCGAAFEVGGAAGPVTKRFCSRSCAGASQGSGVAVQMSDTTSAWLAGIIDGEGSIVFLHRGGFQPNVRLCMINTCRPLVDEVRRVTGVGSVVVKKTRVVNPKHSQAYTWQCHGDNARSLIRQMRPWLIVKAERADRALDLGG